MHETQGSRVYTFVYTSLCTDNLPMPGGLGSCGEGAQQGGKLSSLFITGEEKSELKQPAMV